MANFSEINKRAGCVERIFISHLSRCKSGFEGNFFEIFKRVGHNKGVQIKVKMIFFPKNNKISSTIIRQIRVGKNNLCTVDGPATNYQIIFVLKV